MNTEEILSVVDHTVLGQNAGWETVRRICDEGIYYKTASVCIAPSYVKRAREYVGDRLKICTVIGFPLGYSTTSVKCFEASDAVDNGADEIDMVINLGWLKDGRYDLILDEINSVKKASRGRLLKVIVETCLLTEEEKEEMCRVVSSSQADYIKTSTGFAGGGATKEDIMLFAENMTNGKKIKAAGGISGLADAEELIRLGADRIGTSRVVAGLKKAQEENSKDEHTSY